MNPAELLGVIAYWTSHERVAPEVAEVAEAG